MESKLSDGQLLALKQLKQISEASLGGLTISEVFEPNEKSSSLDVIITYECNHFEKKNDGLPLRHREEFRIFIPENFPFSYPILQSTHLRFDGFPHVQWGKQLCLYQSSNEWSASDGMYGFFDRMGWWLSQGAKGELDPVGGPLHPPVTYSLGDVFPGIIPIANTPKIEDRPWVGFGELNNPFGRFCEITSWKDKISSEALYCSAFLLSEKMPSEYPVKLSDLIGALEARGVSRELFHLNLQMNILFNPDDSPLIVVVGAPMRGTSGGEQVQHLAAWKISSEMGLKTLKWSLRQYDDDPESRELGDKALALFNEWANLKTTTVEWLNVREARKEIVRARDESSSMAWFRDKTVALWGCGAVGSSVGEMLARAGAKKLILKDRGKVAPGLLVRQLFDYEDINTHKVDALKKRLLRINPKLEIEISKENLLYSLDKNWWEETDIIIESTGSNSLLEKFELKRQQLGSNSPVILGVTIGHKADYGMYSLAMPKYSGGIKDIERKVKISTLRRPDTKKYADEFWPETSRTDVFQPEPGCSDPTFVGSAADVISLTARMLKIAAKSMAELSSDKAHAFLVHQPEKSEVSEHEFTYASDYLLKDYSDQFQLRVSLSAWKELKTWREKSRQISPVPETGGLLFGEYNEACRVFWLSEVSGPPLDSTASAAEFQCGIEGVAELQKHFADSSRKSIQCVGTWHTHPNLFPLPSRVDHEGMKQIFSQAGVSPRHSLLLIIGDGPKELSVFTSVFSRGVTDFHSKPTAQDCQQVPELGIEKKKVGLALSGGGARAMAFHLGCLRALHQRGVLNQVEAISTISGGSVLGAAYAYSEGSFDEFDRKIVDVLKRGLTKKTFCNLIFSSLLVKATFTFLTSGLFAVVISLFKLIVFLISFLLGRYGKPVRKWLTILQPSLPRWFNRSNALEESLNELIFGDLKLDAPRRNSVGIVINATELKTGTAFRFGSRESGSSRYGVLDSKTLKVSEAVAASACFPILLPPFERRFTFKKYGKEITKRVHLIDGGVYDNLGVTPLDPLRTDGHGTNSYKVDYLISCSAGAGIFGDEDIPYLWHQRMIRSFDITFKRVQEGSMKILHGYVPNSQLKGFIFSYLGQIDKNLPGPPQDLVPREAVFNYPTDFFAMSDDDINSLSKRGEQLTRLLINHYCPEL